MQNASTSLGSVDDKVQEADRLRNITVNLQAQLRQNMSALEEKLRRAREYVAKVKRLVSYECLPKGFFKNCFSLVYAIGSSADLVQPIKCETNTNAIWLLPIFSALTANSLTSDYVISRLSQSNTIETLNKSKFEAEPCSRC